MGRKEELLDRLRNNPNNVRFEELDKLLSWYGFERRQGKGDHYIYKRKGCRPLSVPRHRPVGKVYVKQALAQIERCAELED